MLIIDDISFLSRQSDGLGISLIYSNVELKDIELEKVLLERAYIPKLETHVKGLKDVIEQQTVLRSLGEDTAYISNVFSIGGGDLQIESKFVDITKAWENQYDYIVPYHFSFLRNCYHYVRSN